MIKPLIRRTLRSLALRIMEQPALASAAKKAVSLVPALDRRLRRIVVTPPAPAASPVLPQPEVAKPVPPEVARVLVDLRHAIAERKS
jgi:hypothetical protein